VVDTLRVRVGQAIARVQTTASVLPGSTCGAPSPTLPPRGLVRPEGRRTFTIVLEGSRHPVVERMMARETFIPMTCYSTKPGRVILLTGRTWQEVDAPQGKSDCASCSPRWGIRPGGGRSWARWDRLYHAGRGIGQSGARPVDVHGEMSETSAILHGATRGAWWLLDEIGRGPPPTTGVAIAWAVTASTTSDCKTIYATHYPRAHPAHEELAHARNFNVGRARAGDEIVSCTGSSRADADRSYGSTWAGSQAAPAVVSRAWQVLALLEAGQPRGAADRRRTSRMRPTRPVQPVGKPASAAQGARSARLNALSPSGLGIGSRPEEAARGGTMRVWDHAARRSRDIRSRRVSPHAAGRAGAGYDRRRLVWYPADATTDPEGNLPETLPLFHQHEPHTGNTWHSPFPPCPGRLGLTKLIFLTIRLSGLFDAAVRYVGTDVETHMEPQGQILAVKSRIQHWTTSEVLVPGQALFCPLAQLQIRCAVYPVVLRMSKSTGSGISLVDNLDLEMDHW